MDIKLNLIDYATSKEVCNNLKGIPTENRVMVVFDSGDKKTESGLFIPGIVKEDIPRKGVVVAMGPITEENRTYRGMIGIGSIITYGLYAGKEIEPEFHDNYTPDTNWKFSILSLNEIIYVEPCK